MPALDATRKIFHPIENRFLAISDNIQFVAAVNRGNEFSATFGIDAAQLDRFAPLQMDYPPPEEEVRILQPRHSDLSKKIIALVVEVADRIRKSPELASGLSVRATDEVCTYLKHPLIATQRTAMLPEVLKSSFCGRFSGRWSDVSSDAGAAWAIIEAVLREKKLTED
jgi:nitric oxide reductase NorQ protein